jgi:hypothetical protein
MADILESLSASIMETEQATSEAKFASARVQKV